MISTEYKSFFAIGNIGSLLKELQNASSTPSLSDKRSLEDSKDGFCTAVSSTAIDSSGPKMFLLGLSSSLFASSPSLLALSISSLLEVELYPAFRGNITVFLATKLAFRILDPSIILSALLNRLDPSESS